MSIHIKISKDRIADFCHRNHVKDFSFFGSVLRDDFGPESDVDVLIEFENDHHPGLMDLVRMEEELTEMFDCKVDLVERKAVEKSENYIRRQHILKSVESVYVA